MAGRFAGEQIRALEISLVLTDNPLLTSFSRENVEDVARSLDLHRVRIREL